MDALAELEELIMSERMSAVEKAASLISGGMGWGGERRHHSFSLDTVDEMMNTAACEMIEQEREFQAKKTQESYGVF